ncbi:MAG: glycine zipper 2TM domain-containing protein [Candidatus Melainabacteria bacterium]|nr:glycine zipper 2TM domain-containing protein [Candidatus Melainabacteria bacterium]
MSVRPILLLALALTLMGCSATMQRGAGLGATVGAVAGAVIDSRNPWRGAVIGGTIGAGTGAIIADEAEREYYYRPAPPAAYRIIVRERVFDGCCWRWLTREVTVFWYEPYQAWGYWSLNGQFIYAR